MYLFLVLSVTADEVGREGIYCAGRRCHALPIQCVITITCKKFQALFNSNFVRTYKATRDLRRALNFVFVTSIVHVLGTVAFFWGKVL